MKSHEYMYVFVGIWFGRDEIEEKLNYAICLYKGMCGMFLCFEVKIYAIYDRLKEYTKYVCSFALTIRYILTASACLYIRVLFSNIANNNNILISYAVVANIQHWNKKVSV